MKKTILLMAAFAIVLLAPSCKSKQQITKVSGAQVEAKTTTSPDTKTDTKSVAEPEVTRNETFTLAEGESNTDAFRQKYHVVVGSFKSQSNAKGLQTSLNAEGNKSIVVVNENGMFRVLMASFNDYSQARARINQVSNRFPDAWVLVQK